MTGRFALGLDVGGGGARCLLLDLVRRMDPDELPKVFLTFSPFVCAEDICFASKTLGVYLPRDVDRALRGARSMREASISLLLLVWSD